MAKVIRYQKIQKMEPREGFNYATSYVKQTLEQRHELVKHVKSCVGEIVDLIQKDLDWYEFVQQPLKGFKTTTGTNRSVVEVMNDMLVEANGRRSSTKLPKDFALAPIERWNKLFADTEYEFVLVQTFDTVNNFDKILDYDEH